MANLKSHTTFEGFESYDKDKPEEIDTGKCKKTISNINIFIDEVKNISLWLYNNKYNKSLTYFMDFHYNFSKILGSILEAIHDILHYIKEKMEYHEEISSEYNNKSMIVLNDFKTLIDNMINDFKKWIDYYDCENFDSNYKHNLIRLDWDNKEEHHIYYLRNKFKDYLYKEKPDIPNKIMRILIDNNNTDFQTKFCIIQDYEIITTDYTTTTISNTQTDMTNTFKAFCKYLFAECAQDRHPQENTYQPPFIWNYKTTFERYKNELSKINNEFKLLDGKLKIKLKEILSFFEEKIVKELNVKDLKNIESIKNIQSYTIKLKNALVALNTDLKLSIRTKVDADIKEVYGNYLDYKKIPNNWILFDYSKQPLNRNPLLIADKVQGPSYVICSYLLKFLKNIIMSPIFIFFPLYLSYKYLTKQEKSIKDSILGISCCLLGTILPIAIVYGTIYYLKRHPIYHSKKN
jgi:hypothetical protein